MSEVRQTALRHKGFKILRGTLEDFVQFLAKRFPAGLKWQDVQLDQNPVSLAGMHLTPQDIDDLRASRVITSLDARSFWDKKGSVDKDQAARAFLRGGSPTWELCSSEVPVQLSASEPVYEFLSQQVAAQAPFLTIIGQAGSGKTTAVMQQLLRLSREKGNQLAIVEVLPSVSSLTRALKAILKVYGSKYVVIFINDLFLFGGALKEDIQSISAERATIVATSRSSEWHSHFKRHLSHLAKVIEFHRFAPRDEPELIKRLEKYVPSPEFMKLKPEERIGKLRKSKEQLLIALREATDSRQFDEIISQEYMRLGNEDAQHLMLIVGAATIARVGVQNEMAYAAYTSSLRQNNYEESYNSLTGIIEEHRSGRLFARHELYVRHIFEHVAPFRKIVDAICDLLQQFTIFEIPIIRRVSRQDAALFKFLLNHDFIFETAKAHDVEEDGLKIYERFEVPFQLDGHFWLQYAMYLDKLGRLPAAEDKLRKSISAYPENPYAQHALARLQLIMAASENPPRDHKQLISEGVATLEILDSRDAEIDDYPLVTLSYFHIEALVKNGDVDTATKKAREYIQRLRYLEKRSTGDAVQSAIQQLSVFVATGDWRHVRSNVFRRNRR